MELEVPFAREKRWCFVVDKPLVLRGRIAEDDDGEESLHDKPCDNDDNDNYGVVAGEKNLGETKHLEPSKNSQTWS